MTLLLHCGYHKTASSYLQSCFASHRELLAKHGIHYPDDPRQKDAAKGIPTAGNGAVLCQALLKQNVDDCRQLLRRYFAKAKEKGANKVLLSAEGFFTYFSRYEGAKLLMESAKLEGFQTIRAFIFFRPPVEHAVSVYCHRAASGKLPPFVQWLETGFETPKWMDQFADHFGSTSIDWQVRLFQPKIDNIVKVLFSDWMHIQDELDLSALPSQVNVSITMGEAELVSEFNQKHPGCGRYVSAALKTVPAKAKADESDLKKRTVRQAAAYFQRHHSVMEKINRLLPPNQQLSIPEVQEEEAKTLRPVFSPAQVIASGEGLEDFKNSRTLQGRFGRFLNRTFKPLSQRLPA